MQRPYRNFLLATVLVAFAFSSTYAQPLIRSFSSLEAMIADADFVAIGSIASVKENVSVTEGTFNKYYDPNVKLGYELTTQFDQIVKRVGRAEETAANHDGFKTFQIINPDGRNAHVSQLVENKVKGVWLIYPRRKTEKLHRWKFLPFDRTGVYEDGDLPASLKPPMFASDLSILTTNQQIEQRIKQYGPVSQRQYRSGQPRSTSVYVPRTLLRGIIKSSGTDDEVYLPIDSDLSRTARRLIEAPAEFVSPKDANAPWTLNALRSAGINLLGDLKSEASIQLLKNCLDPSILPFASGGGGSEEIVRVRVQAYQQLLDWQVNPPKPVFASEVTRMVLCGADINDETLALVADFENLQWLDLRSTKVTPAGLKHLAKLKQLKYLGLSSDVLTDEIVQTLAANEQLHLLGSHAYPFQGLIYPNSPSEVRWLSVTNSPMTDVGLKSCREFKNITNLNLEGTQITDAAIEQISEFKKLKVAFLRDTGVTKEGVAKLRRALPKCKVFVE